MSKININPYDTLTGLDGLPLDQGYIYIGLPNLNPATNPQTVYWDQAQTMPVNQPIRTANGRVWNAGSPALIYAAGNYSVQVLDKNQAQVVIALNVPQPVDNPVPVNQGGTGATTAAQALINLGVIAALVQQTYTGYTTAGIATAYTLTPAPAIAASPMFTRFNVRFHLAGTGTPTLAISGLAPKSLKQYDGLGAKVTAVIKLNQLSDVVDDGVDYVILDPLPPSVGSASGVITTRQSAQFGIRDTTGNAAFLAAGAALNFNVLATAVALTLGFANGEGSSGNIDLVSTLAADALNQGALAANNTNYIFANYVNAGAVTWGSTRAPFQDGRVYDRTLQSVLQFGGAAGSTSFPDDFGNTWAAQGGARVQTNQFKFGTGGLGGGGALNVLNGATDFLKSTNFATLGPNGWALRGWFYITTLPGAGVNHYAMSFANAAVFGANLLVNNNAGTIRFRMDLSSNGTGSDIGAATGTTTPLVNTWYFVELTYDALAGVYRMYINGVQEASIASALKICGIAGGAFGAAFNASAFMNGYIDKPEFLPYCEHPGGTAYAPPAGAPVITTAGYASEYYDYSAGIMRTISAPSVVAGTDPAFTPVQRLYCGECDTSGAAVTAARSYQYLGSYDGPFTATLPAIATQVSFNHNIGSVPDYAKMVIECTTSEFGYAPGDRIVSDNTGTNATYLDPASMVVTRRTVGTVTSVNAAWYAKNKTTGAIASLTVGRWKYKFIAKRPY